MVVRVVFQWYLFVFYADFCIEMWPEITFFMAERVFVYLNFTLV